MLTKKSLVYQSISSYEGDNPGVLSVLLSLDLSSGLEEAPEAGSSTRRVSEPDEASAGAGDVLEGAVGVMICGDADVLDAPPAVSAGAVPLPEADASVVFA